MFVGVDTSRNDMPQSVGLCGLQLLLCSLCDCMCLCVFVNVDARWNGMYFCSYAFIQQAAISFKCRSSIHIIYIQ